MSYWFSDGCGFVLPDLESVTLLVAPAFTGVLAPNQIPTRIGKPLPATGWQMEAGCYCYFKFLEWKVPKKWKVNRLLLYTTERRRIGWVSVDERDLNKGDTLRITSIKLTGDYFLFHFGHVPSQSVLAAGVTEALLSEMQERLI